MTTLASTHPRGQAASAEKQHVYLLWDPPIRDCLEHLVQKDHHKRVLQQYTVQRYIKAKQKSEGIEITGTSAVF
ncbi:hypothetical protein J6590_049882 [Homalodisca vitripennis]|nr:hypothetical protein J6590_049882 [Homalodisca vitripennis]